MSPAKRSVKNPNPHGTPTPPDPNPSSSGPAVLTPRQVQIIRLIRDYRQNHGCSPTLQELAAELSVSKVTVFEHVEALVRKGILRREANKARSLILADGIKLAGDRPAATITRSRRPRLNPAATTPDPAQGHYPLAGTIAAGQPLEALQTPDTVDLTRFFETREGTFALHVRGNSMIDDHICDGDIVLIQRRKEARNGEIVVAVLENGDATLKRIYRENGRIRLQAANPEFKPIYVNQIDIQGILVGVVRRL